MPRHAIPNVLTLLRFLGVPIVVGLHLLLDSSYWPFIVFALLSLTDYLDGFLARRWAVQSRFGAFADPAVDKLLVCSLLIIFIQEQHTLFFTLPALIIIFRELLVSMAREYLAAANQRHILEVSDLGKYKTSFQMISLSLFLLPTTWGMYPAYVFFYMAVMLTVLSFFQYSQRLLQSGLLHKEGM